MDEKALVQQAQRGDIDAFNQLVLQYQRIAYSVAYRVLGNSDRAMDATQDAFLRGYRALSQFRGGSFKAWILRIVTNCCYDQLRAQKRRPTSAIDDMLEDDEHSDLLTDHSESPQDHIERQDMANALRQALDQLPDDQRMVVVLSDIEGLSYDEIASTLAINLGTVKSRLSRARAKLRDHIRAHQELFT